MEHDAILVDYRIGSREFIDKGWLPAERAKLAQLPAADFAWLGWDGEREVRVGVERKVVTDLVASMKSGRLVEHQVPALQAEYDVTYLLVEGALTSGPDGRLLGVRGESPYYAGVVSQLHSLASAGLILARTDGIRESTLWLTATHAWWQRKEHSTLSEVKRVRVQAPGLLARWARELPGVGPKRMREVVARFASGRAMACAEVETWVSLGFTEGFARKCVERIREGER